MAQGSAGRPVAAVEATPVSDAELITATRGGDGDAFEELYQRHAPAAHLVARQYAHRLADAEDLVSEAFTRIYRLLLDGRGPDTFFRAYLFTAIRNLAAQTAMAGARQSPTDFDTIAETIDDGSGDLGDNQADQAMVRGAMSSLPERWRAVLWYAEVEGLGPAEFAPVLGLTANGAAALLYRAREGLRQAYLQQHLSKPLDPSCQSISDKLGGYARSALSARDNKRVGAHLAGCARCVGLVAGLADVNRGLRAVFAPAVFGAGIAIGPLLEALRTVPPVPHGSGLGGPGVGGGPWVGDSGSGGGTVGSGASSPGGASNVLTRTVVKMATTKVGIASTVLVVATGLAVGSAYLMKPSEPEPEPSAEPTAVAPASAAVPVLPDPVPTKSMDSAESPVNAMVTVFTADGSYSATEAGAPLAGCAPSAAVCPPVAASTTLNLPNDAEVAYALLIWAGSNPAEGWGSVQLVAPDGSRTGVEEAARRMLSDDGAVQSSVEVTGLVAAHGAGTWTLDGVAQTAAAGGWAGWALVVAYSSDSLGARNRVAIHEGSLLVGAGYGRNLAVDTPRGRAEQLGGVVWGADPSRAGNAVWMVDIGSKAGVFQSLLEDAFNGLADGFTGQPLGGVDVFTLAGPLVFPTNPAGTTVAGLRFSAASADSPESDPYTVGAISVVAPLDDPTSAPPRPASPSASE
jgi:RNA polymerase sigma factor (sigma-70 family)